MYKREGGARPPTAGMKSEIRTAVKIDGLQIVDAAGQICWRDSIEVNTRTNMPFRFADKYTLYRFPDMALKDSVNELVRRLGSSSLATTNHAALSH
jgi:hypothetical protein